MVVNLERFEILLIVLLSTGHAYATPDEAGLHYTGGTLGIGLVSGPSLLADSDYENRTGYLAGINVRFSSVMQVIDTALEYTNEGYNPTTSSGQKSTVQRHSLTLLANAHPLFLRIWGNDRFWYTVAGWYLQGGLGAEWTRIGDDSFKAAMACHLGTGIETPLDDPNNGGGFWLGFNWRWKFIFMNPKLEGHRDLDTQLFLLTLTYKWNNISFARVNRPPELKYR